MAEELKMAVSTDEVKLDLACGQNKQEGFVGVDLHADADIKHDLLTFPWPWEDNSVDEIHCSHFCEHIPMRETESGQDLFLAFMDECWRILKPGGKMRVIVPNARCDRAFQDPTHRRFFVPGVFFYLNKEWRESQGLDHYLGKCDFAFQVNHTMPVEMQALSPEAQARKFNECWNVIYDWIADLIKLPPDPDKQQTQESSDASNRSS